MNNPYFIYWLMNGHPPSNEECIFMIIGMIIVGGLCILGIKLMNKPKKQKKEKR